MILIQRLQNKQGEVILIGGASRAMPVRSWPARGAGGVASALSRRCRRMRPDEVRRLSPNEATRRVRSQAETSGMKRKVVAESALGRWPNLRLQRTRPLLRMLLKLKGSGWGLAAEAGTLG